MHINLATKLVEGGAAALDYHVIGFAPANFTLILYFARQLWVASDKIDAAPTRTYAGTYPFPRAADFPPEGTSAGRLRLYKPAPTPA